MNRLLPRACLLILLPVLLTCSRGYCNITVSHVSDSIQIEPLVTVYSGKVLGKSRKAQHICLGVGQGSDLQIIPISFTEDTEGLDSAVKGDNVLIRYTKKNNRIYATEIKPRFALLPVGVQELDVGDLKDLIDDNVSFTLVDSRPAASFLPSHLPGAISIPYADMKKALGTLPADKSQMLVFYGQNPTTTSSTQSALQAIQVGYTNVYVMLEGKMAWDDEEYASYADDQFILEDNAVLVDLRIEEKDITARIPGSVNMPFTEIEDYIDEIPTNAPVVLYSDDEEEMLEALRFFWGEGYGKVSLVQGGIKGWKKNGGELDNGPAQKDVLWTREPAAGEVSVVDFKAALADPDQAIILDVRESRGMKRGKFATSYNLPLSELSSRMDDFFFQIDNMAKQKKIFIHCTTGARAEMAYRELKQEGYNAYYLAALVVCKGENCRIIE